MTQQNTAPPSCRACGHVALVSITQEAAIDEAAIAEQEAAAVELLTRRGWTCVAPGVAA